MSVAVDPGASFVRLEVYSHGRRAGAMLQIQPCNVANVRHFRDYYTATSEDGPILFGFGVPELETVAIAWPYDLGTPVIAKAFDLPGRDGLRFWAAYAPDGWENGFPHHFDAADDPVQMAEGGQDACLPDGVPLPEG